MNLSETVTNCAPEGAVLHGSVLYRLHVSSPICGSAGTDKDTSHFFPQDELASITLVGVRLVMEELRLELSVRCCFPSAHWSSGPY